MTVKIDETYYAYDNEKFYWRCDHSHKITFSKGKEEKVEGIWFVCHESMSDFVREANKLSREELVSIGMDIALTKLNRDKSRTRKGGENEEVRK